ncbi:MAG TPA: glucose-6-phosphate isomerase [Thermoanaerobaculia bacterium]|nr:glucose-6-phosphate isomerase [Thermoanaerobaculia bacterium]
MSLHPWQRYQALSLHVPTLSLLVDLSKTCLQDDALRRDPLVSTAFPAAFAAMEALEAGAIANPDEKRRVGHYWLRAPERAPDAETKAAIQETRGRIEAFAEAVHAGGLAPQKAPRFTNLLVVGIGGSALGPQFVADALGSPRDPLRPFFFDNTDPDGMARELSRIASTEGGLPAALTVVISKSGGTKETRNGMLEAADAYRRAGLDFQKHAVAVTGQGSELDEVAARGGWLNRFPMWDWVGGRTSELSAVGLLPAALQGLDVDGLLAGAAACDEATRVPEVAKNPAAMLALAWYRETGGRGQKDMVVLPYKDRLLLFSRYLQQLVMESLGKEKDLAGNVVHQGIAVYGNKGSTDQHAYVQQLREGVPNFFVTFVEVACDLENAAASLAVEPDVTSGDYLHGFLLGTRKALYENGRGSITLTLPDASARSVGALIALYERTVGLYAQLVGINAYHQPGVEAGKKAAAAVLALQGRLLEDLRREKGLFRTAERIAASLGAPEETETVFKVLEHLAANPDHAVARKPGPTHFLATYGIR